MAETTVSLWTPLLYVSILFTALVIFSKVHRKRKQQKLANTLQFYENNFAKDIYTDLKSQPKVPAKLLKSALMAWASEDFTRLLRYRENEPIMQALLQKGEIGEEAFERFTGSKTLNERELQELAGEALQLDPNWTTMIATASDIAQQHAIRRRMAQLENFKREYYELGGAHATAQEKANLAIKTALEKAKAETEKKPETKPENKSEEKLEAKIEVTSS